MITKILRIVGGICLAIGATIAVGGVYVFRLERALVSDGRTATGTVTRKVIRPVSRSAELMYVVQYQFSTPEGREVHGSENVPIEIFDAIQEHGSVQVRYLPDRPRVHHVEGAPSVAAAFFIAAAMCGGVGGVMLFFGIRIDRREARLRREGVLVEATVTSVLNRNLRINGVPQGRIAYGFADEQGTQQSGRSRLMPIHEAQRWAEGDRGYVRYDRHQPKVSLWLGRQDNPTL